MEKVRVIRKPNPELSNGLDIQYGDTAEVIEYDPQGKLMSCFHYKVRLDKSKLTTFMMDYWVESLDEDNQW